MKNNKKTIILPLLFLAGLVSFSACSTPSAPSQPTSNSNIGPSTSSLILKYEVKLYDQYLDEFTYVDVYEGETPTFKYDKIAGYNFLGYFSLNGDAVTDTTGKALNRWSQNSPTELVPHYEIMQFNISVDASDGIYTGKTSFNFEYGEDISTIELIPPTKQGYSFVRFDLVSSNGAIAMTNRAGYLITGANVFDETYYGNVIYGTNLKIKAVFEEARCVVYVFGIDKTYTGLEGEKIDSIPFVEKEGEVFTGYYFDSECTKPVSFPYYYSFLTPDVEMYPGYQTGTVAGLSYVQDSKKNYIASYDGDATNLYVPDNYMGTKVVALASVKGNNLKKVVLSSNIVTINDGCFKDCTSVEEVQLPTGLTTIPKECFMGCSSLKSVTLPRGVSIIRDRAFSGCTSLSSFDISRELESMAKDALYETTSLSTITVQAGNDKYIVDDGVLYEVRNSNYQLAKYPSKREGLTYKLKEKTTKINEYAFCFTNLRKVEADGTLNNIGEGAFYGCELLTTFKLSEASRLTINKLAFSHCPLLRIVVLDVAAKASLIDANAFEGASTDLKVFVLSNLYTSYTTDSKWRELRDYLTKMGMIFGDYCIEDYEGGVKILTYFGDDTNLVIQEYLNGKTVKAIDKRAFIDNVQLKVVELNAGLELIDEYAFDGCTSLKDIYIKGETLKTIVGTPFPLDVNIYLRSKSNDLLNQYKSSWTEYADHIWTAL